MSGAERIAIVGMACRVPGADTVEELWRNLSDGVESISTLSADRLAAAGVDPEEAADPRHVPRQGEIRDIELFDAEYFGYSPREAELLDPQQRIFLECAVEALQRAGHDPARYAGLIGVYGSVGFSDYLLRNVLTNPERLADVPDLQVLLSADKDYIATRVAYKLDLRGPAVTVQTACSSSLVAVHLAAQALIAGECDMALAGGAALFASARGYRYQEGGVLSSDGHCRAFDARADGTVPGGGAGLVVLKRLEDAQADGDEVHAVLAGSAINNDGARKVGFTAPSRHGQRAVIMEALAAAGVDGRSIGYVEAHGAATVLGDPIEVAALTDVFGADHPGRCALGSVKTNVGHLDAAAGIVALLKAVLAVEYGAVPPSLHFEETNPEIDFSAGPFFVPTAITEWPVREGPRRAGISSFGIGGTNAHIVVEQAPPRPAPAPARSGPALLVWSARTSEALDQTARRLADHLTADDELAMADVAWTLQAGRPALSERRALVAPDAATAAELLRATDAPRVFGGTAGSAPPSVAFLLAGVGDQYEGMASGLYRDRPAFRAAFDRCAELFAPHLGTDLRELLRPVPEPVRGAGGIAGLFAEPDAAGPLHRTSAAQPLLFATGYALARLLQDLGVRPAAMLGYSVGEYVAACLAGVFDLADAARLIALRAAAIESLPEGRMLAVLLGPDDLAPYLGEGGAWLAAVDGPRLSVLGGTPEAIDAIARRLAADGVAARALPGGHAFHTPLLRPLERDVEQLAVGVELRPPRIPFLSNVTGTWITDEDATDPGYWARHMYRPVRFADGLARLWRLPDPVIVELGPGQALGTLAVQHPDRGRADRPVVLSTLPGRFDERGDAEALLEAIGRLWLTGVDVDWAALVPHPAPRRVVLPTYPFQRRRLWLDPARDVSDRRRARAGSVARRRTDPADWFLLPSWQRGERRAAREDDETWLVLAEPGAFGEHLGARLAAVAGRVLVAVQGETCERGPGGRFTVDFDSPASVRELVGLLTSEGRPFPGRVLYCLWDQSGGRRPFYGLLYLAQALAAAQVVSPVEITTVTACAQAVAGEPELSPRRAMTSGICRVLPQEFPQVSCRTIDVVPPPAGWREDALLAELTQELLAPPVDFSVAYRERQRWVQTYQPERLDRTGPPALLRANGVYLIVGGLGTVGAVVAEYLARTVRARLAIMRRTSLPARDEWDRYLADAGSDERIAHELRVLRDIEAAGAEVVVVRGDVADRGQFASAVAEVEAALGPVNGVFHSAGVVGEGASLSIEESDRDRCERQFRSKVDGLPVMAEVLGDRPLDFVLLNSSISSVLGGIGYAAYASANTFMDLFAHERRRHTSVPWTSMNWEGFDYGDAAPEGLPGATLTDLLIDPADAAIVLDRVLAGTLPAQIVNSTGDLTVRTDQWIDRTWRHADGAAEDDDASRHARPNVQTSFVAPRTDEERRVAGIWRDLLGIDEIGLHDNFFELGGHSLIATRLVSRLADDLGVRIPLRVVLSKPTLADLVEAVRTADRREEEAPVTPIARERYRIGRAPAAGPEQRPRKRG